MRVHELAKELGVASKELLETLEKMGVAGKSASSSVPEDLVPRLRASGGKATKAAKPRQVMEPPPKPRAKTKPKPKAARGRRRGRGHARSRGAAGSGRRSRSRSRTGPDAASGAVGPAAPGRPRFHAADRGREDRSLAGGDREDPVHGG
jgi:translation initiation factor IF-2